MLINSSALLFRPALNFRPGAEPDSNSRAIRIKQMSRYWS